LRDGSRPRRVRQLSEEGNYLAVSAASWRIEDILMAAGLATAEDLERARRRMRERGGRLLANLHALGRFDDDTFARGLGNAFQVPVADASRLARVAAPRTPSRRAALRALAIERVLLPIGAQKEPRLVEVAVFDPTDKDGIDRLRAICGGADGRANVAPRGALLDAIAKTYGREASGVLETPSPSPHVTRIHDDDDVITQTAVPVAPPALDTDPGETPTPVPESEPENEEVTPPPRVPHRDVRLHRVLLETVGLLSDLLEERVARRPRSGKELARYARLVGRELGMAPATVDVLGTAASLHAVERALAEEAAVTGEIGVQLDEALGWSAGSPDGIGPMLRALRRFPLVALEGDGGEAPYGAVVIAAVREFLGLAHQAPDGQPDMNTVNQLLRVTTPEEIIEALGRVVAAERQKEQGDAV
jgi:hypothetical protein